MVLCLLLIRLTWWGHPLFSLMRLMDWLLFAPAGKTRYTGKTNLIVIRLMFSLAVINSNSRLFYNFVSYVCNLQSGNYRIVKHLMQFACKSVINWLRNHIYFPSYMHTKWSAINKTLNCTSQVWRAVVKVSSSFTFPNMACLHLLLLLLLSLPIGGPCFMELLEQYKTTGSAAVILEEIGWLSVHHTASIFVCLFGDEQP